MDWEEGFDESSILEFAHNPETDLDALETLEEQVTERASEIRSEVNNQIDRMRRDAKKILEYHSEDPIESSTPGFEVGDFRIECVERGFFHLIYDGDFVVEQKDGNPQVFQPGDWVEELREIADNARKGIRREKAVRKIKNEVYSLEEVEKLEEGPYSKARGDELPF